MSDRVTEQELDEALRRWEEAQPTMQFKVQPFISDPDLGLLIGAERGEWARLLCLRKIRLPEIIAELRAYREWSGEIKGK